MKKILLILTSALLTGCISTGFSDIDNNKFVYITPKTVPAELEGYWSGNLSFFLTTIHLNQDGNGVICSSGGTKNELVKLKYLDSVIHTQAGTKFEIKSVTKDTLELHLPYGFGKDYAFKKDPELKEAAIYCTTALKQVVVK